MTEDEVVARMDALEFLIMRLSAYLMEIADDPLEAALLHQTVGSATLSRIIGKEADPLRKERWRRAAAIVEKLLDDLVRSYENRPPPPIAG